MYKKQSLKFIAMLTFVLQNLPNFFDIAISHSESYNFYIDLHYNYWYIFIQRGIQE